MDSQALWKRFKTYYFFDPNLGFSLDISRMNFAPDYFGKMQKPLEKAFRAMQDVESGTLANPDEKRRVGHYWLRKPALAPSPEIAAQIEETLAAIKTFAHEVRAGNIAPPGGGRFKHILLIGIGGSALGPQFVSYALQSSQDPLDCYFFDNTDPDGMQRVLACLPDLARTLCIVVSKSGGTRETLNGMLVAKQAWIAAGLDYAKCFVAVTGEDSRLDKTARGENWLARFPMWDWVGGRTSELSAVGLLPAALQGFAVDDLLRGARDMDEITRRSEMLSNPAALLALMWHWAGEGAGKRSMVVLPYNDRLELFSRYLQQLVMESLGKEKDLDGKTVQQGLTVYGNKGSTDQHAYIQQLRDGPDNFFAVFIEALKDASPRLIADAASKSLPAGFCAAEVQVDAGITSGDYLAGFLQGTREALYEKGRQSIGITVNEVSEYSLGMLIALFERAVGLYASLININAYHQPGVEAGKKAAAVVLEMQQAVLKSLKDQSAPQTAGDIAHSIGSPEACEIVFKILRRLAANQRIKTKRGPSVFEDSYFV